MTRAALILLLLAACAPVSVTGHRDPAVPIRSLALFDRSRLSGYWHEVAGYPVRPGCRPGLLAFSDGGGEVGGKACFLPLADPARVMPAGPGRFRAGAAELWVLWADADNRTLVIGTPSGAYAAVLNRSVTIPPDRMRAALRVLAFNGYRTQDLTRRGG